MNSLFRRGHKRGTVKTAGAFTYKPLSSPENNIRLLTIEPGTDEDPISCTTSQADPSTVEYTCLSYTWGSARYLRNIVIDDSIFSVRPILYEFLVVARQKGLSTPLWIDAICINQDDIQERNQQVQNMRHIYALAKRVIVWLGSGNEEAAKAFRTLLELDEYVRPESTPWDVAESERPESNPWDIASNTEVISELRYWNRLWIIQELLAGKEIRLWCDVMDMYWSQFQSLYEMGSSYYSTPRLSDLCKFVSKGMRQGSLLQMIAHFSTSSCTDLRDRVYGFLGISSNGDGFHVNYNETCTQLFFRVLEYSLTDLGPRSRFAADELEGLNLLTYSLQLSSTDISSYFSDKARLYTGLLPNLFLEIGRSAGDKTRSLLWTRIYPTTHIATKKDLLADRRHLPSTQICQECRNYLVFDDNWADLVIAQGTNMWMVSGTIAKESTLHGLLAASIQSLSADDEVIPQLSLLFSDDTAARLEGLAKGSLWIRAAASDNEFQRPIEVQRAHFLKLTVIAPCRHQDCRDRLPWGWTAV